MSIELEGSEHAQTGAPELTELGKSIEMLRIRRGVSKQHLARRAGTSRQQLWRVMTGKSELTSSLRLRLADVLGVDHRSLHDGHHTPDLRAALAAPLPAGAARVAERATSPDLGHLVDHPGQLAGVLGQLPGGDDGRRLKRALLDAIEDLAIERALPLGAPFFDVRRRVIAGDL